MTERFWTNEELFFFRIQSDSDESKRICGAWINEISWTNLKETKVVLIGPLPAVRQLIELKDGERVDILNRPCGHIDEYAPDLVIIKLNNCKVTKRWFEGESPRGFQGETCLYLQVSFECEMEFLI